MTNYLYLFWVGKGVGEGWIVFPILSILILAMIHISGGEKLDVSVHTPSVDPPYRSTLHTIKGQSEHRSKMCNLGQLGPLSTHLMAI